MPTYPNFITPLSGSSQFATIAENHVFSPTFLNTFRFSFSRTIDELFPTTANPSLVTPDRVLIPGASIPSITAFSGAATIGPYLAASEADQNLFTWSDDIFWTKGKHAFKFGFLINHYIQFVNQHAPNGSLGFSTLSNFFSGVYSSSQYLVPGSDDFLGFRYGTYGFYAQDDYRMTSRLTLNLGLRYEFASVPHAQDPALAYTVRNPLTDTTGTQGPMFLNNTFHNISPRIGVAWDPFGNGKTSIRAGSGIYYDVGTNYGGIEENASQANPPIVNTIELSNILATPVIPLALPLYLSLTQIQAPRTVQYNLQQPTLLQYNMQVQQLLPWGMALSVGYAGSRGWHLLATREGDPPVPLMINALGLPVYGCTNTTQSVPLVPAASNGACPAGLTNSGPRINPAFS